jgi:nucleoside-diphosphate-sugar epimerase
MDSDVAAERFIVSAGNHSFRDIFTMMAVAMNKRPPRYHANSFVTGLVWRLSVLQKKLSGAQTVITKETAETAQGYSFYNNSKLLEAFPAFSYTPIQQTIDLMARSYLSSL